MTKKRLFQRFLVVCLVGSAVALTGAPAASATPQVPSQLAGTWTTSFQGGTQFLTLADSRFMFFSPTFPDLPAMGAVSVSGQTITFYSSNRCEGTGTYQWSLSGSGLTFVQVPGSNDPCRRALVLTSGTWTRFS